jgi:hypothetical protein
MRSVNFGKAVGNARLSTSSNICLRALSDRPPRLGRNRPNLTFILWEAESTSSKVILLIGIVGPVCIFLLRGTRRVLCSPRTDPSSWLPPTALPSSTLRRR